MGFLDFVLQAVAFGVGTLVGAFTLVQMVLITSVGIPLATRLKNEGLLPSYAPISRYVGSFSILFLLLAGIIFLLNLYFQHFVFMFLFGLGVAYFISSNAARHLTPDNLSDFLQMNARFFTRRTEDIDENEFKRLFDLTRLSKMEGNQVFATVFGDFVSNTIFYGAIVLIILILGKIFWWLGVIAGGLYVLLLLVSVLQNLLAIFSNIVAWFLYLYAKIKREKVSFKEQFWLTAAGLVQSVELAIGAVFIMLLYQAFFPSEL